jgi:hypothetical protein
MTDAIGSPNDENLISDMNIIRIAQLSRNQFFWQMIEFQQGHIRSDGGAYDIGLGHGSIQEPNDY